MKNTLLADVETWLDYTFQNKKYLEKALTHSSTGRDLNYERLEFLGDRVLGLVMAHWLFETFTGEQEGGLAKRHAALVQGRTLSNIAATHDLGRFILMSQSERESGGDENDNILADVMEALLGAVYIDGGLAAAEKLIKKFWGNNIHTMTKAPQDPKTELQEWAQAHSFPLPDYEIVGRDGPDHAPVFEIEVRVQEQEPARAEGASRRQAEKKAAQLMLKKLKKETA